MTFLELMQEICNCSCAHIKIPKYDVEYVCYCKLISCFYSLFPLNRKKKTNDKSKKTLSKFKVLVGPA